ncbi:MAG: copper chaperone PCu(A)C [Aliishimia sp.]
MALKTLALAAATTLLTLPALAGDRNIMIKDPYVRSGAKTGAAFFTIMNHSDSDDRLIGVTSDVAPRVELHTHLEDANGVMKMREIQGGIAIPAGGMHQLKRGADHVMFMGLSDRMEQGATVHVTLSFEKAGDVMVEIPVDNERQDKGGHSGHGSTSEEGDHSGHKSN